MNGKMGAALLGVVCLSIMWGVAVADDDDEITRAVCVVNKTTGVDGSEVEGTVTFVKISTGVRVDIDLRGFTTGVGAKHGFHVHKNGSMENACSAADGHFNPGGQTHGAPNDTIRHVGDLGNIVEQANGLVEVYVTDNVITLSGSESIVGRAIVIHEGEDDLGKGGDEGSLKTGNAGPRMACCLIEAAADDDDTSGAPSGRIQHALLTAALMALIATFIHVC